MQAATTTKTKRILIIFYSTHGHIEKMARKVFEGVNAVPGVKGELWQVPETLSDEVLTKIRAAKKPEDVPVLTYEKLEDFASADGYLFGISSRFGMMSSQMKTFFDSTGQLWVKGSLVGKPAGVFFCTGTQGGGQETTAFTTVTQFVHHGMVFVPVGYSYGKELFTMEELKAGSPYGAGTYSGADGSRQPSELEYKIAKYQGEYFAKFVNKLH